MAIDTVKLSLQGQEYTLNYDIASGTYKATITAPSVTSWNEADHKFYGTVTATDTAGNSVTATKADFDSLGLRVLEKTAPAIAVAYPTSGAFITSNRPTFKWNVTDAGSGIDLSTLKAQIDSGAVITSGFETKAVTGGYSVEYTPDTLADGAHTVRFNVSDNDGNAAAQASVTFTVDTVPPALVVSSPAEELITNQESLTVSGTTNDATSSPVTLTVNGAAVTVGSNGAWSANVTLSEGNNTITVIATDASGQSTTVTRTVTLDTKAPKITAITLTPNPVDAGASFIITVTVTD